MDDLGYVSSIHKKIEAGIDKLEIREDASEILNMILFVLLFTVVVIRNAWVCDDAYIGFRTVDNFVNGYGLTWNTSERVPVYTNPLWILLLSALYFFTHEIYFTGIYFSIILSIAAILLFTLMTFIGKFNSLGYILNRRCIGSSK
ncbi:MAG: hypothetical protein U9M95_05010 [Candidatus Altiarchaeota archaeon]|nr:hypothetical protein [Candidatus Altiarchaeota archaeon]